jgi:hypothetical protein
LPGNVQELVDGYAASIRASADSKRMSEGFTWILNAPELCAKSIICAIIDAFTTRTRWISNQVEDACDSALLFGIRAALMAMLKRDVLQKRDIRLCIRPGCGRYFTASGPNKMCCSPECTTKRNNKIQYEKNTKPRRRKEAARRLRKG